MFYILFLIFGLAFGQPTTEMIKQSVDYDNLSEKQQNSINDIIDLFNTVKITKEKYLKDFGKVQVDQVFPNIDGYSDKIIAENVAKVNIGSIKIMEFYNGIVTPLIEKKLVEKGDLFKLPTEKEKELLKTITSQELLDLIKNTKTNLKDYIDVTEKQYQKAFKSEIAITLNNDVIDELSVKKDAHPIDLGTEGVIFVDEALAQKAFAYQILNMSIFKKFLEKIKTNKVKSNKLSTLEKITILDVVSNANIAMSTVKNTMLNRDQVMQVKPPYENGKNIFWQRYKKNFKEIRGHGGGGNIVASNILGYAGFKFGQLSQKYFNKAVYKMTGHLLDHAQKDMIDTYKNDAEMVVVKLSHSKDISSEIESIFRGQSFKGKMKEVQEDLTKSFNNSNHAYNDLILTITSNSDDEKRSKLLISLIDRLSKIESYENLANTEKRKDVINSLTNDEKERKTLEEVLKWSEFALNDYREAIQQSVEAYKENIEKIILHMQNTPQEFSLGKDLAEFVMFVAVDNSIQRIGNLFNALFKTIEQSGTTLMYKYKAHNIGLISKMSKLNYYGARVFGQPFKTFGRISSELTKISAHALAMGTAMEVLGFWANIHSYGVSGVGEDGLFNPFKDVKNRITRIRGLVNFWKEYGKAHLKSPYFYNFLFSEVISFMIAGQISGFITGKIVGRGFKKFRDWNTRYNQVQNYREQYRKTKSLAAKRNILCDAEKLKISQSLITMNKFKYFFSKPFTKSGYWKTAFNPNNITNQLFNMGLMFPMHSVIKNIAIHPLYMYSRSKYTGKTKEEIKKEIAFSENARNILNTSSINDSFEMAQNVISTSISLFNNALSSAILSRSGKLISALDIIKEEMKKGKEENLSSLICLAYEDTDEMTLNAEIFKDVQYLMHNKKQNIVLCKDFKTAVFAKNKINFSYNGDVPIFIKQINSKVRSLYSIINLSFWQTLESISKNGNAENFTMKNLRSQDGNSFMNYYCTAKQNNNEAITPEKEYNTAMLFCTFFGAQSLIPISMYGSIYAINSDNKKNQTKNKVFKIGEESFEIRIPKIKYDLLRAYGDIDNLANLSSSINTDKYVSNPKMALVKMLKTMDSLYKAVVKNIFPSINIDENKKDYEVQENSFEKYLNDVSNFGIIMAKANQKNMDYIRDSIKLSKIIYLARLDPLTLLYPKILGSKNIVEEILNSSLLNKKDINDLRRAFKEGASNARQALSRELILPENKLKNGKRLVSEYAKGVNENTNASEEHIDYSQGGPIKNLDAGLKLIDGSICLEDKPAEKNIKIVNYYDKGERLETYLSSTLAVIPISLSKNNVYHKIKTKSKTYYCQYMPDNIINNLGMDIVTGRKWIKQHIFGKLNKNNKIIDKIIDIDNAEVFNRLGLAKAVNLSKELVSVNERHLRIAYVNYKINNMGSKKIKSCLDYVVPLTNLVNTAKIDISSISDNFIMEFCSNFVNVK